MSDTTVITDTNVMELSYDTLTVSKMLGVQESTIRKYCALMQKHNYQFNKNPAGHRIFYPKDIEVIKKIVDLKNSGSLTLADAVKEILNSDISDITDISPITNPNYDRLLGEFEDFKNEQQKFNQTLLEQLEKQQEYIKNSINERDRNLMFALRETMETKKQIAAIAEEIEKEKAQKKKSWWKFWG